MASQHACFLCDYVRVDDHVAVLDPVCPRCGGHLGPPQVGSEPAASPRLATVTGARWFERTLVAVVVLPLLAAAAKVGWAAAGPTAAAGALAVAGLVAYVALAPATRHR